MKANRKKLLSVLVVLALILMSIPLWFGKTKGGGTGPLGGGGGSSVNTGYEPWYYYIGDMVNSASGNLFLHQVDVSVGARGFHMQIVRAYNSDNSNTPGAFGYGWTHNYDLHFAVDISYPGDLIYHDGDGSEHKFTATKDGYDSPPGKSLRLTATGTGLFLWEKTGTNYTFNSTYALTTITDKNGNRLHVSYDNSSRITSISDDSNLMLNFSYNGTHISEITDALNRTVEYSYDQYGNLVNVTYPNGGVISYGYDTSHRLIHMIDQVGKETLFTFDPQGPGKPWRVGNIYLGAVNESVLYEAFDITYTVVGTTVKNARGYYTTIVMDSKGSPTQIGGPACGSIFAGTYGTGEALEQRTRLSCVATTPSGCSTCSRADYARCTKPEPAIDVLLAFSSQSESVGIGWDTDFNINTLEDALSHTYNFTYDSKRNVVSVTDPSQNATSYEWSDVATPLKYVSVLENVTNPRNYTDHYSYDDTSNLVSVHNALDDWTNYTYDSYGNVRSIIDALGHVQEYSYNYHGFLVTLRNPLNETVQYGRDAVGRLTNATLPRGGLISYSYDARDNVIAVVDPLGNATNMTYNLRGDLVGMMDASGHWTNYTVDTILGKMLSKVDAMGNVSSYAYDKLGNLVTYSNKRNYSTSSGYDAYNRLANVTDASGNISKVQYNSDGMVSQFTDRANRTTTYSYDSLGRVIAKVDASGNSTQFTHNENGDVTAIKDARGHETTFSYDALDQVTNITGALGNSTLCEYDGIGNLNKITNAQGYVYEFNYDALGRLIEETDPLNHTTRYSYDTEGHLVNVTDANGHSILRTYDGLGRVEKIINSRGNSTEFTYDAVGNLQSVKDAEDHLTNFTYDELNRLLNVSSPLGLFKRVYYDPNGNIIMKEDSNGNTETRQYDSLDRLEKISYQGGENVSFRYNADGQVIQISSSSGYFENWSYDAIGHPQSIQISFGPLNKTVSYSYDEVGNRVEIAYPEGGNVSYQFDKNNRVVGVADWSGSSWSIEYDALGRRTGLHYPNNVSSLYSYDNASRLIGVVVKDPTNTTLINLSYTYDAVGNVLAASDGMGNTTCYSYDEDNQLIQTNDTSEGTINYTYDGVGNRIWKISGSETVHYTYNADNELISAGTLNYTYDNNGNMITKSGPEGLMNYSYNHENRLIKVVLPDNSSVQYVYTPTGRLMERVGPNVTTYFVHDVRDNHGFDNVIAEHNTSGSVITWYVHGPGIDEPLKRHYGSNDTSYFHADLVGSVRMLTDTAGNAWERYRYSDFGNPLPEDPGLGFESFLFTGRIWDNDTKVHNFRTRHYDSISGRFLQKDSAGIVLRSGQHLYVYGENNPISYADPSGSQPVDCVAVAAASWLAVRMSYRETRGDKWWHAYAGCQMGKAGCSYADTKEIAATYEEILYYLRNTPPSPLDVEASRAGWSWHDEKYYVLCTWCLIITHPIYIPKAYTCEEICDRHQADLDRINELEQSSGQIGGGGGGGGGPPAVPCIDKKSKYLL